MHASLTTRARLLRHLLFWLAFYALYIKLGLAIKPDWPVVAVIYIGKIAVQALAAYVLVYAIIPALLNRKKYLLFGLTLFAWTYIVYSLLIISRAIYLEPAFMDFFKNSEKHIPIIKQTALARLTDLNGYLDAVPWLFTPAAFMGLIKFYQTQLMYSRIKEEKKSMELAVLKNQLNPHFLFNTLNNLYTLALKKDDRTPAVIARLSEILDFVLYRCHDDFISSDMAIDLLENFIALESIRYGDSRLQVTFNNSRDREYPVPPLILLTLLENAFKHGVTNETGQAQITISLVAENKTVHFKIMNSKPGITSHNGELTNSIGLKNVQQQLNLLYPARHELLIDDQKNAFTVNLILHEY